MISRSISYKFKIFCLAVIALTAFIIIYSTALIYEKNNYYPTVNRGRILISSAKIQIEEALEKGYPITSLKTGYPYAVVDPKGRVLASSIDKYEISNTVDLQDFLEYDGKAAQEQPGLIKYSIPIIIKNTQVATAVFFIPKEEFLTISPKTVTVLNMIPIIISVLIIVGLALANYIFSDRDILRPISQLHKSAKSILKGDFSDKITYDYDSEIGLFCHDFEAMRDELKFSKERELAVKANEKELLACLSHDIKTPLTAINGYVSGIKDGIVKDRAGIENYCSIILKRVKMLSKLLDDILEHSKAELNKMDITLSEFYCGQFFKDLIEDLYIEIKSKGLQFNAPEEIPDLLLNADRKRLTQVMYNLVSNSIKYSKEQGVIEINFESSNNFLKVYIKDTGMGINSADVPYIFNKFYRGEKSRNQNIAGSGLGLSISKYIMEAHGGFIQCVESSDKGTTMCFGLPI